MRKRDIEDISCYIEKKRKSKSIMANLKQKDEETILKIRSFGDIGCDAAMRHAGDILK